jgi:hypothetical protein
MNISKKVILCMLLSVLVFCEDFSSQEYFKLSAKEKMDRLWDKITEDRTPASWHSVGQTLGLFTECHDPTFDTKADVLPQGRKKLIHTVGSIAKAKFVSTVKHPYTGILQSGCEDVLLRLSVATPPDITKPTAEGADGNFAPGISIKFLIDGQPSENLVAMFSTNGQSSWNFFKNDHTPQFDIPDSTDLKRKLLATKFSRTTYMVSTMAMKPMSSLTNKGETVEKPYFPFKIIFRPNEVLKNAYSDNYERSYVDQLAEIKGDIKMYDVYAMERPDCNEEKIGEITLTSQFTTSKFGDLEYFIRHPKPTIDIAHYPEWLQYRDEWGFLGKKAAIKPPKVECPFMKAMKWLS